MARESQSSSLFTQIDITPGPQRDAVDDSAHEHTRLLHQMLAAQDRQNELLEEMVANLGAAQRQRSSELTQWKDANPRLADRCRSAAECLAQVQGEFLHTLTDEIEENADALADGDFMFNEFIDRYGPRMAHLNGVLQMLTQLSSNGSVANDPQDDS